MTAYTENNRMKYRIIGNMLGLLLPLIAHAEQPQDILNKHYQTYKDQEYFSGVALSIYTPKTSIANYYAGTESHEPNSKPISATSLFQIGSITKSFTAAIVLQLEKEKKLTLDSPLKTWLPSYDKWSTISI